MFTGRYRTLVAHLVDMRKRAGLTQRELAAAMGWPQSLIGRLETCQRRIDLVEFIAICQACDADPHEEIMRLLDQILP